jgi:hypothetical protein
VRYGWNVEEIPRTQLSNSAIVESDRRGAGYDQSHVFDVAARGIGRWPDVLRPSPPRFVRRSPDRHPTDVDDLEAALLERADLIGRIEALQDDVDCHALILSRDHMENGVRRARAASAADP